MRTKSSLLEKKYNEVKKSDDKSVELSTGEKGLYRRLKKSIIELKLRNKELLFKKIESQNRNKEWEKEYFKLGKSITYILDENKRFKRHIKSLEDCFFVLMGSFGVISCICFLVGFYNLFKKTPESNPASETPLLKGVVA